MDRIDDNLRRGLHYRTSGGTILTTLNEVVEAILADDPRLPATEGRPAAVPLGQPVELALAKVA